MKKILIIVVVIITLCACTDKFKSIKKGMPKGEVVNLVGEPIDKVDVIGRIQWWKYKEYIIVIDSDTVVNITTQKEVKEGAIHLKTALDSLSNEIDKTIQEIP